MKIAIIGAGMAGLSAARALRDHASVKIFEKSRGVGGRISTRYAGDYEFDHGAQYFTITDASFQAELDHVCHEAASRWESRGFYLQSGLMTVDTGRPRWVGRPRMNAVPKALAQGLSLDLGRRVSSIEGPKGALILTFETGESEGPFDHVICTAPPQQASALIDQDSSVQRTLKSVDMSACFALMVGWPDAFDPGWDSLRVSDLPISWLAMNSAKPSRNPRWSCLVVHSAPDWSDANKDADRDWVQSVMLDTASALCGVNLSDAPHIALHRWLYAFAEQGTGQDFLLDPKQGVLMAGDWCVGGRVEGAFQSGRAAASHILQS